MPSSTTQRSHRSTVLRSVAATALSATVIAGATVGSGARTQAETVSAGGADPAPPGERHGTLADGATWTIRMPADWNGTLLLYSHGLVPPGEDNPAVDTPDPVTGGFLLAHGYALAGSSYATTGMAVEEAIPDQLAVLDVFTEEVGRPDRTIAWGSSLGGMVTAALMERHPQRFDGGLSMCGVVAGSVGLWNSYLDTLFVLKTLIATEVPIDLVDISDPFAAVGALRDALAVAQATPEGRARIALASAVGDIPGWAGANDPRPADADVEAQEAAQFENFQTIVLFGLALRADVEARAGGNPSWNAGVDYAALLRRSTGRAEVRVLYERAGLDLRDDLHTLAAAPRITADAQAVKYLTEFIAFDGELRDPMLTLHTNGDPLATVEHEQAYGAAVRDAGGSRLLRQTFTERAGHCTFTPAETVATLQTLIDRVDTGRWRAGTGADALNERATGLGPDLNIHFDDETQTLVPTEPAFDDQRPATFLRPFDLAG